MHRTLASTCWLLLSVFLLLFWMDPLVGSPPVPVFSGLLASGFVRSLVLTVGVQILWHTLGATNLSELFRKVQKKLGELRVGENLLLKLLDTYAPWVSQGVRFIASLEGGPCPSGEGTAPAPLEGVGGTDTTPDKTPLQGDTLVTNDHSVRPLVLTSLRQILKDLNVWVAPGGPGNETLVKLYTEFKEYVHTSL